MDSKKLISKNKKVEFRFNGTMNSALKK